MAFMNVEGINTYCLLLGSGKTAAFLIPMFEKLQPHTAKVL
jgi:hypothetical protein